VSAERAGPALTPKKLYRALIWLTPDGLQPSAHLSCGRKRRGARAELGVAGFRPALIHGCRTGIPFRKTPNPDRGGVR